MKRILYFMLVLLIFVPAASSYSASIDWAGIWAENRYYESTDHYVFGMDGDTKLSTDAYDVYMYFPSWTGNEYHKLNHYYFNGCRAAKLFTTADGYPPPGGDYEQKDIYFFIDEDESGDFDKSSEPYQLRNYDLDTYTQIPLVQNVNTFFSGSDTIVSWDGISDPNFGDGLNDHYRVRVMNKDTNEYYFDSGRININSLNKYTYNLGDLSVFGDNFWIGIEARDETDQGLVNRSRYYASAPVPGSVGIIWAGIWAENRYYEGTDQYVFGMDGDTKLSTDAYDVYMYVPSWTGNEYHKLNHYIFNGPRAAKLFTTAYGYPPPGGDYEQKDIYFFIDEDESGDFDKSSEPYQLRNYDLHTYTQIPLVQNVNTFFSGSDTIVIWDGISDPNFGDGLNDHYRVRVMNKDTSEYYFDSGIININPLNKYTYNLGDLSVFGDNFWIGIEARDETDQGLVNRSRYYASAPVPNPPTMPWIPLLLLDD